MTWELRETSTSERTAVPTEAREPTPLDQYLEGARVELQRYVDQASNTIRERPVAALAGAMALGFLAGRWASRR